MKLVRVNELLPLFQVVDSWQDCRIKAVFQDVVASEVVLEEVLQLLLHDVAGPRLGELEVIVSVIGRKVLSNDVAVVVEERCDGLDLVVIDWEFLLVRLLFIAFSFLFFLLLDFDVFLDVLLVCVQRIFHGGLHLVETVLDFLERLLLKLDAVVVLVKFGGQLLEVLQLLILDNLLHLVKEWIILILQLLVETRELLLAVDQRLVLLLDLLHQVVYEQLQLNVQFALQGCEVSTELAFVVLLQILDEFKLGLQLVFVQLRLVSLRLLLLRLGCLIVLAWLVLLIVLVMRLPLAVLHVVDLLLLVEQRIALQQMRVHQVLVHLLVEHLLLLLVLEGVGHHVDLGLLVHGLLVFVVHHHLLLLLLELLLLLLEHRLLVLHLVLLVHLELHLHQLLLLRRKLRHFLLETNELVLLRLSELRLKVSEVLLVLLLHVVKLVGALLGALCFFSRSLRERLAAEHRRATEDGVFLWFLVGLAIWV